jgi:hypothetical protein
VEEINAMRHQSTEKLARNLEQLLSGPKVGAESKSAPTPAGAGAGGGGGGGTGTGGVESDQSKGGEGEGGHDGTSASLSEQEGNKVLSPSLLMSSPSHASHRQVTHLFSSPPFSYFAMSYSFPDSTMSYSILVLHCIFLHYSFPLSCFEFLHSLLFSHLFSSTPSSSHIYSPPLPPLLTSILLHSLPSSFSLLMHQIGKGESYPTLGSMKPKKTPPVTATSSVEVKAKANVELAWGRGLTPAPATAGAAAGTGTGAVGTGGSSKQAPSGQGQGQMNKKGTPLLSNSR